VFVVIDVLSQTESITTKYFNQHVVVPSLQLALSSSLHNARRQLQLHIDNGWFHTATLIMEEINYLHSIPVPHPQLLPNLVFGDFAAFGHVKGSCLACM
jgi:hypothetical protein